MYHKQKWNSLNEKAKVWLELCDFAFLLKYQGLKMRYKNKTRLKKELHKLLKTIQGKTDSDF